ncbi:MULTISPECIES: DUF1540 domain-containing protein [Clostridium]|uniref:DUF1540 domain-containing protein n=1 Tax=Clostridium TaxID=1485 RepID=UPI00189B26CD|nr:MULTISPECIES: DUF1540 domain-containing protein [Clostridium]MCR1949591.1 DUF1540 domain-containing protein [Clostridium sp. DSM 100503]MDI9216272.1 DUF1540 domain-containing protein [Clostridium tertium]
MNRLACNVRKCNYNFFGICDNDKIKIVNKLNDEIKTSCVTFEKYKISKRVFMMGKTDLYIDKLYKINDKLLFPHIECNAEKCFYNKEKTCYSNYVMIKSIKENGKFERRCECFKVD